MFYLFSCYLLVCMCKYKSSPLPCTLIACFLFIYCNSIFLQFWQHAEARGSKNARKPLGANRDQATLQIGNNMPEIAQEPTAHVDCYGWVIITIKCFTILHLATYFKNTGISHLKVLFKSIWNCYLWHHYTYSSESYMS